MKLTFLPADVCAAVGNLNLNYLTEIRLRRAQPVIIEYSGEYRYLSAGGATARREAALVCADVADVLYRAMGGCVYSYAEELKEGFITISGGIRIGVAGEYVTEGSEIKTIARPTSLNIRIPHLAEGCSDGVYRALFANKLNSVLIYSRPGCGKTTMLRDLARRISKEKKCNVLVLDVRSEIGGAGAGYDLGETVDVVRSANKLSSIQSAVRAMKPDIVITDELYGEGDMKAVKFARDCGIAVAASSHICEREQLKSMPFDYFVHLTAINAEPEIYDKNFDTVCNNRSDDVCGRVACDGKKEEGAGFCRTL